MLPPFQTTARPIAFVEAVEIDGHADHAQVGRVEMVVLLEVAPHHFADGDDEQRLALILVAVQGQKGAVGRIDQLEQGNQAAQPADCGT